MTDFISFGEVLFDCYSDGQTVLGGAPLNCAGHMARLGLEGLILSAVGDDDLGKQALKEIAGLGIDTDQIQVTTEADTGTAELKIHGRSVTYTFNSPAAWDMIEPVTNLENARLVYFGTLAQRSAKSKEALYTLLENQDPEYVFFDVNLRKDFYTKDIVKNGLEYANILKMGEDEIPTVLSLLGVKETGREALSRLCLLYNLKLIIITDGKRGVSCLYAGRWYHEDFPEVSVHDTVGAGDALSGGFLATFLRTGNIAKALHTGAVLASYVVTQRGGLQEYDEATKLFLQEEGLIE